MRYNKLFFMVKNPGLVFRKMYDGNYQSRQPGNLGIILGSQYAFCSQPTATPCS